MKYFISVLIALSLSACSMTQPKVPDIYVGTGSVNGTYYPSIETLCGLINEHATQNGMHCAPKATGGSVDNLNALANGDLKVALVQGDILYQAYSGQNAFAGAPNPQLRSIMALYSELLALVVRADSEIETLADISGKKINLGNSGSGTEATVREFLKEADIGLATLAQAAQLSTTDALAAMEKGDIDGMFFMVGHPNASLVKLAETTPVRFIMLEGAPVYSLQEKFPYYVQGFIRGGLYKGVDEDVPTLGVKATLVTVEDASADIVSGSLSTVLDNFDEFKKRHRKPEIIGKESFIQGLGAPLHPAAEVFYKQHGLK
jgi:TRAP transporter TAXI family solute receptor